MNEVIFTNNADGTDIDELEVTTGSNILYFKIDSPWYGGTEAGFGAELEIALNREEVASLITALTKWQEQAK